MSNDGLKIRNILNDTRKEEVCLDDVVMAFANSSSKLKQLEYNNSFHSYREASKAFNEAKRVMVDFEARLRGEVKESIVLAVSKVDPRVKYSHPNSFEPFLGDGTE